MLQCTTKYLLVFTSTFILTGCGGQSLIDLAENVLYPFEQVDKKYPVPESPPAGHEQHYFDIQAHDGSTIKAHAWSYKHPEPNGRVLVYLHGNGMNLQVMEVASLFGVFQQLGFSYIAVDYPGLGRSEGVPNEPNLVAAGKAALAWADKSFPRSKVILWGRSLGAAVAAQVAVQMPRALDGLLLTSPWSTFMELALDKTSLASGLPEEWVALHTYDTVSAMSVFTKPAVVMHGDEDDLIPFKFGEKVAQSFPAGAPAEFLVLPGREHNDVFQEQLLWDSVSNFLK